MRVPTTLPAKSLIDDISRVRTELERARRQVSTGKRILSPADDPAGASRASVVRDELATTRQYRDATDTARTRLLAVDNHLDQMERVLEAAQSIAAAGQSADTSPNRLAGLSAEVGNLRDQLLSLANARYDGAYLFAGEDTLSPAFDASAVYQGDNQAPVLRVGDQTVVETGIPGSTLLVGTLDAFQVLADLRDALAAVDGPGIAAGFSEVQQVLTRVSQYRVRTGLTLAELDKNQLRLAAQQADDTVRLGKETDTDLASAISELALRSNALDATLGAGARILPMSLLDVLG